MLNNSQIINIVYHLKCLPVGTGRVVSVSQLVNIFLYVTKFCILYCVDSVCSYNGQLYWVSTVLSSEVMTKSKKMMIFVFLAHKKGLKMQENNCQEW